MPNRDDPIQRATAQVETAMADASLQASVQSFFDPQTATVSHIAYDLATREAAIIDPVRNYDPSSGRTSYYSADQIIEFITSNNLKVKWLLETHAHADHVSAAPYLKERLGGILAIGDDIIAVQKTFGDLFNAGPDFHRDGTDFDRLLADGDEFQIGALDVVALHVPGHTPACVAYVIGEAVFVGDTMFMPDYGTARADFPGGDARALFRSIRRILALPLQTRIFLCHDYQPDGRAENACETTVADQRSHNIHAHDGVSESEFVSMRERRDKTLAMPRLLLPSVQVNMRGGRLPPPEENGISYLKIPVDAV